ncbi:hypothetical protein [Afipia sp. DC4300-2b1]|uniref:hypothetical protein n=1 Tax=Afipia sp. DC4300-2b1 TaxID=2804672 RepID=UPI003CEF91B4
MQQILSHRAIKEIKDMRGKRFDRQTGNIAQSEAPLARQSPTAWKLLTAIVSTTAENNNLPSTTPKTAREFSSDEAFTYQ